MKNAIFSSRLAAAVNSSQWKRLINPFTDKYLMISDQRRREIIAAFQASFKRDNSADLNGITLEELIAADEMLGSRDLNEAFRLRMRNRIASLRDHQAAQQESKSKWLDRGLGVVVGIALTLLGVWLAS